LATINCCEDVVKIFRFAVARLGLASGARAVTQRTAASQPKSGAVSSILADSAFAALIVERTKKLATTTANRPIKVKPALDKSNQM